MDMLVKAFVKAIAERMPLSESFTYHQASMIRHSMAYTTGVELRKAFIKGLMKMALNTLKQNVSFQRLEVIREELNGMAIKLARNNIVYSNTKNYKK